MICKECNSRIDGNATFCPFCGAMIDEADIGTMVLNGEGQGTPAIDTDEGTMVLNGEGQGTPIVDIDEGTTVLVGQGQSAPVIEIAGAKDTAAKNKNADTKDNKKEKNASKKSKSANTPKKKSKKIIAVGVLSVIAVALIIALVFTGPYFINVLKSDKYEEIDIQCNVKVNGHNYEYGSLLGNYYDGSGDMCEPFCKSGIDKDFDGIGCINLSFEPKAFSECYVREIYAYDSSKTFSQNGNETCVGDNVERLFETFGKPTYQDFGFDCIYYTYKNTKGYSLQVCTNNFGKITCIWLTFEYESEAGYLEAKGNVYLPLEIVSLPNTDRKILVLGYNDTSHKYYIEADYSFLDYLPDNEITDIYIADGIRNIPEDFFNDDAFGTNKFKNLKNVYIGKSVEEIGLNAFSDSKCLESVYVDSKNCKINYYLGDDLISSTLGYNPTRKIDFYCHMNSTAESYFEDWQSIYNLNYID